VLISRGGCNCLQKRLARCAHLTRRRYLSTGRNGSANRCNWASVWIAVTGSRSKGRAGRR